MNSLGSPYSLLNLSCKQEFYHLKCGTIFISKLQQECIPVGCVPPACCPYLPACTAPRGCTWSQGLYLVLGGVPGPRGSVPGPGGVSTWSWGLYLIWGDVPGWGVPDQVPPCEQNHRRLWKYNLAPTSLRAVNIDLIRQILFALHNWGKTRIATQK